MKKLFIVLLFVGLLIPAVSAEVLYDETIAYYQFTGGSGKGYHYAPDSGFSGGGSYKNLVFPQIQNQQDLGYIVIDTAATTLHPEGVTTFTYTLGDKTNEARMHVKYLKNVLGVHTGTRYTLFFDNWDVYGLTGTYTVETPIFYSTGRNYANKFTGDSPVYVGGRAVSSYKITCVSGINFKNHIRITENNGALVVTLNRIIDGLTSASTLNVYDSDNLIYTDTAPVDVTEHFLTRNVTKIDIVSVDRTFTYPISPATTQPDDSTVTVYIKNSQTGALIANSRIVIDGLVDGEYYNVVNRTEPSGIFTITLQPTGGGQPNPDGYRLIVTADGYNNPMPEINFTVDDYKNYIHCLLDPIAGGPVNENKTFIDFFVRDMSSNPISGATVKFGKYTLITNSAGYTVFEVDKNNNYSWTISKSGYGALTGNAVIGNDPRHTINTVLASIVTPTTTTPIPTSPPIGPTPTMTAPTGEPVSNWLEWFAAHFGMILGGGVEIGKIFMWLCFTVPVGVYVGKEAKTGAAGFMAGAGIVTLFFVLIGWVPIWLVVLLALIIGLLYAKEFNSPDNGGGR